mmetsp:Transcript_21510/g.73150  ORF Transcript_21510/g.73150 Transcript_21510/m.73150 type:complete len:306 (-) Transcript_21510:268-1185(-)
MPPKTRARTETSQRSIQILAKQKAGTETPLTASRANTRRSALKVCRASTTPRMATDCVGRRRPAGVASGSRSGSRIMPTTTATTRTSAPLYSFRGHSLAHCTPARSVSTARVCTSSGMRRLASLCTGLGAVLHVSFSLPIGPQSTPLRLIWPGWLWRPNALLACRHRSLALAPSGAPSAAALNSSSPSPLTVTCPTDTPLDACLDGGLRLSPSPRPVPTYRSAPASSATKMTNASRVSVPSNAQCFSISATTWSSLYAPSDLLDRYCASSVTSSRPFLSRSASSKTSNSDAIAVLLSVVMPERLF